MKYYKYLVPLGITVTGIFFAVYSLTHYEFYQPTQGPMQGAVPAVLGILLALGGMLAVVQARKENPPPFDIRNWSVAGAMGVVIAASYVIGFLPSIFIFLVLWMKKKEKLPWKTTILITAVLVLFVVFVFSYWMQIPFTEGVLFERLLG